MAPNVIVTDRRRSLMRPLVIVGLLLPLAPAAHAWGVSTPIASVGPSTPGECAFWGPSNDIQPWILVTLGPGTAGSPSFYLDMRGSYFSGNGWWLYEETNDRDSLQRGGDSPYIPGDTDVCRDPSPGGPDTNVW